MALIRDRLEIDRSEIARYFWPTLIVVALADVGTKYLAHTRLLPQHVPRELVGDSMRLTLVYNPGAAFGLYLGAFSRWIFLLLTIVALVVVTRLYRGTLPNERARALALGLVSGGAVGNLINRVWSARGVVDFIDIGLGGWRWPTFNVADIGVSVGALLLAWVIWSEERHVESERQENAS